MADFVVKDSFEDACAARVTQRPNPFQRGRGHVERAARKVLPPGVIEIPAMLIGGQAGLVLGGALLGGRGRRNLRDRMRQVRPDILTLAGGMAVLLVWAGLVESFLSQFHAPVLPYGIKISFGVVELLGLIFWLAAGGRAAARLAAKESLGTHP